MEEAKALGVEPILGVRMRLASLGAGKWQNSGGDKAKFGLSPRQLLDLWKSLRDAGMGDALKLLHFHMGSQISNVRAIARGMPEATRHLVELAHLGAGSDYVDDGGAPASGRTPAATRPSSASARASCWTCGSRCATPAWAMR